MSNICKCSDKKKIKFLGAISNLVGDQMWPAGHSLEQ